MPENVKRVFYVRYLAHPCYLDIVAQRPEIRPWPGERPSGSRGTSAGLAATRRQVREVGFAAAEAEVRDQLANAQGGRPLTPAPPAPMRRRKIGATVAACNNARSVRPV